MGKSKCPRAGKCSRCANQAVYRLNLNTHREDKRILACSRCFMLLQNRGEVRLCAYTSNGQELLAKENGV